MIDITTIQTFKIPPSIKVLQESNEALKLVNDSLTDKNDTLKKILIVTLISLGLVVFVKIVKKRKQKNEQEK
jgi:hypothetical protein